MWQKITTVLRDSTKTWLTARNLLAVAAIVALNHLDSLGYQLPEWLDLLLAAFGVRPRKPLSSAPVEK